MLSPDILYINSIVQERVWGVIRGPENTLQYVCTRLALRQKDVFIPNMACVRVAGLNAWNFSSSSRQACPELFSRFEIKEQDVVSLKPLLLFPFPSSLFPACFFTHLFFSPCSVNRAAHMASCDNLPHPTLHPCIWLWFWYQRVSNIETKAAILLHSLQAPLRAISLKIWMNPKSSQCSPSVACILSFFCPSSG